MAKTAHSSGTMMPLPSLLRASMHDAAANSMRAAGRAQWNDDDWNAMCATSDRLIRACYGRSWDKPGSDWPAVRFGVAERLQRDGHFDLSSNFDDICDMIDALLIGEVTVTIGDKAPFTRALQDVFDANPRLKHAGRLAISEALSCGDVYRAPGYSIARAETQAEAA